MAFNIDVNLPISRENYEKLVNGKIFRQGIPRKWNLRKGDVVLWHFGTAQGSAEVTDLDISDSGIFAQFKLKRRF